jgi:hypothetical protein
LDGFNKILKHRPMTSHIVDRSGIGAGILIVAQAPQLTRRIPQIRHNKPVLFDNHGPFAAGKFDAPRTTWISGCSCLKNSPRSARKLPQGDERIKGA